MSIHPRHAENLLAGRKTVELRKTLFTSDVSHVVVYATAPTKAVVGWLEVEGVEHHSPSRVWELFGSVAGISRTEFRCYFHGHRRAVAIRVRHPRRLARPVSLHELGAGITVPQSFCYLSSTAVELLAAM
jgi:predicted transcriptional regulator